MKNDFDKNFIDSMNFAALMTLLETMEEDRKEKDAACLNSPDPEIKTFDPNTDITRGKERLTHLMQTIYDEADKACGTKSEEDVTELISGLVCGLFFETIETADVTNDEKSSIFDFAVAFSRISTGIDGSMLFSASSNELADKLSILADLVVNMITTGASKADISTAGSFARMLAEFLCDVETAIGIHFPSVNFRERLPIIAMNKFIDAFNALMKTIEEENPDIENDSEVIASRQKREHMEKLTQAAQSALDDERFLEARDYYEEILAATPEDWLIAFYSVYCDYAALGIYVPPREIIPNCSRVGVYACKAVKMVKQQLFSRGEIADAIMHIAGNTIQIATNYFVATMNDFRQNNEHNVKIQRVNEIIKMLFNVGDEIEQSFNDDTVLCAKVACKCWEIAFTCYESCDMSAPPTAYEHHQKLLKYNPSYQCSKPVNVSGCYIATCVYGSYDCPEVWTLRRYRDYILAETWYGRAFIHAYYAVSPKLVKWFGHTKWFKQIWRNILDCMVVDLRDKGIEDSPYEDCPC